MKSSRQNSCKVPISIREWFVCIFAALTLAFTPWCFGGYNNWSLHILLLGGLATFLLSIVPMPKSWNGYDQRHANLKNCKRLLLQPFFLFSLSFLGYIFIQCLNPSIVQVFSEKSWWVEPMLSPLGSKFPSSVKTSYNEMNAFRTLAIQASSIGLALGVLVGIQRRIAALVVLWAFVSSGVIMSFIAILQKLSGSQKLLWIVETLNPNSWGTFAYRNQAAAFLILITIISCLLYFYYFNKSQNHKKARDNGGPHYLCLLYIFLLYASIWLALSRGGIIIGSFFALIFSIILVFKTFSYISLPWHNKGSFLLFGLLFICGVMFVTEFSDWGAINKRIQHFQEIKENIEIYDRTLSSKATWEMAQDRLLFGWGAGSFRYIFPIYQKNYETIWYHWKSKKRGWQGRRIYHYAHNDWLQFLAEYGIVGCTFLGGMFLCLVIPAIRICSFARLEGCLMLSGVMLVFIHNFVDFIFSCPAYWVAFFGSFFLIIKLYNLERSAQKNS